MARTTAPAAVRGFRSRVVRAGIVVVALALLGTPLNGSAEAATSSGTPSGAVAVNVCPQHPAPGYSTCLAMRRSDVATRTRRALAVAAAVPAGYAPGDLKTAYNIATTQGSGGTVAIVDAFDAPSVEADLGVYRSQYGLPACTTANGCFHKVSQTGSSTSLPTADGGWASESALDTEMVSAGCPLCDILLVEANSAGDADLGAAENYAAAQPGVRAVSNSFGGPESSTDPAKSDTYFNHPGVAITASSGDQGYGAEFPAASPNVIAVGGTSLSRASNSRGWSESVWDTSNTNGTGSGCSAYEPKPIWQLDAGCTHRAVSDISAVADPATGVAVYDSYGSGGWTVFGGTSVSSPLVAAMYAEANNPLPSAQYAYLAADLAGLNDVTSGQNASSCSSYLCQAGIGWDGPTGNGTPNGLLALGGVGSILGGVGSILGDGGSGSPTGATSCPTSQRLTNPGFESGSTSWAASNGVVGKHTGNGSPHRGSRSAQLDGHGRIHTDTLAQTVTVPTLCTNATVSFWLKISTKETTRTAAHDKLTVTLGSTKLATYSNLNHGGYKHFILHTTLPAGTTSTTLKFTGKENSSRATWFAIDDTSLTLS